MKDKIIKAIANHLRQETYTQADGNNEVGVAFGGSFNIGHFTHDGFCKEFANEIFKKIEPILRSKCESCKQKQQD